MLVRLLRKHLAAVCPGSAAGSKMHGSIATCRSTQPSLFRDDSPTEQTPSSCGTPFSVIRLRVRLDFQKSRRTRLYLEAGDACAHALHPSHDLMAGDDRSVVRRQFALHHM